MYLMNIRANITKVAFVNMTTNLYPAIRTRISIKLRVKLTEKKKSNVVFTKCNSY